MQTKDKIDKQFAKIEENFRKIGEQYNDTLEEAFIKPIHPNFPFAQNGICCLIASMGSGKSYNYIKYVCQQEVLFKDRPFYELVCICSTSAKFDKTVEIYKRLIKRSKLVCVQDTMLLAWLNKYMRRILKYNAIAEYLKNGEINDELQRIFIKKSLYTNPNDNVKHRSRFVIAEDKQNKPIISYNVLAKCDKDSGLIISSNDKMDVVHCDVPHKNTHNVETLEFRVQDSINRSADTLQQKRLKYCTDKLVKYKWKTHPHRCLLILDDFASHPLLRHKETEMSRMLKKLRHFNINVIICVQTVKSISKDIKRTLSDIVLFPGISFEDFMDLMKESPASVFDRKVLYEEYSKLHNPHDMFTIHIKAHRVIVKHAAD